MGRRGRDPFDLVDDTVAAFRNVSGFQPYTFVVWVAPPDADERREKLICSFRYEGWACITHVEVHGPPRSAWHRRVAAGLRRAGYETWLRFDDETSFRRLLPNARSRKAELAFLEALVESGDQTQWPKRKPIPYREGENRSHPWALVINTIRESAMVWTDACIGFSRRAPLVIAGRATGFHVTVSMLAMYDDWCFRVCVDFHHLAGPRTRLPTPLRRLLRRELAKGGYRFLVVKRGHERVRNRICAERNENNAMSAAAECLEIFEHITTLQVSAVGSRRSRE
jgi:hypothetical protein